MVRIEKILGSLESGSKKAAVRGMYLSPEEVKRYWHIITEVRRVLNESKDRDRLTRTENLLRTLVM
jgi:hypothetical protein